MSMAHSMESLHLGVSPNSKTIVLVRHGESEAQAAKSNGISRTDPSLRDCSITRKGRKQAEDFCKQWGSAPQPDLIVVSPLKRALETSFLCFPGDEIKRVMHPSIAEVGSKIPENMPRSVKALDRDRDLLHFPAWQTIDKGHLPTDWPECTVPTLPQFTLWLEQLPHAHIVVVCHHNIIQSLLGVTRKTRPMLAEARKSFSRIPNCVGIQCTLQRNMHMPGPFLMSELERNALMYVASSPTTLETTTTTT
eukprot:m.56763 g.56763  ORF g.56763 m.56763 type:complete len:250 (+) comp22289_c0_seq1:195-944(+)